MMGKNTFNKYLNLTLCTTLVLTLSACGNQYTAEAPAAEKNMPSEVRCEAPTEEFYCNEPATDSTIYYDDDFDHTEPSTESYSTIVENGFIDTAKESFSTFSIDVDTASYTNTRRYLNSCTLPPVDAVRTEEFINYFDYNYPNPTGSESFSITQEVGPCPWNNDHQLLLLGLHGKELDPSEVSPSNLVFLLDVSGSMSDANKLPLLKKSFSILTSKLKPSDRISIVIYAGSTGVILDGADGNDQRKINRALESLEAGGSTAGADGITLAYEMAEKHFITGGNNRIILATDGDFNVGPSSTTELLDLIQSKRDKGIYFTVLGLGMGNYKDDMLETIADNGNGNYAYIDSLKEANKVFNEDLTGTLFTIAKDVKIQVAFNPNEVASYRLIGYENRVLNKEDFDNDTVDAGEIGAGHTVTALYEIIPAIKDPNNIATNACYEETNIPMGEEYGLLKLRYKAPDCDTSMLITTKFSPALTLDTRNLTFASCVAEYCMLLRNSSYKGNASYQHILNTLKEFKDDDEYKEEFYDLVEVTTYLVQ